MSFGPLQTLRFIIDHPLGGQRPLESIVRYLRWQVASRLSLGPVAVDFVNDARLLVRPGMTGATGNVYVGLHEFQDMAFLLHALRPEDLFVDVGANVGSYTVLAAKAIGSQVVAFEPVASAFAALRDNVQLNGIDARVDARNCCVGSSPGVLQMTSGLDSMNHVLGVGEVHEASAEVQVVRLDDALAGRHPFLIKMDVEGYEHEVLRGATQTLSDPKLDCIIMEINASGQRYARSEAELEALVRSHGFEAYSYTPSTRQLAPAPAGATHGDNAIFVRNRARVEQRLRDAPSFHVLGMAI